MLRKEEELKLETSDTALKTADQPQQIREMKNKERGAGEKERMKSR